ncbi:MAG: carbonic anhydrase family protein [Gammaproteobacteria bacterium]|nr:carbonic anhydrase family protein [Gammaproteobacteria bacterium]
MCFALNAVASPPGDSANWGYEGSTGPDHWAAMKQEFAVCSEGKRQSPINIDRSVSADLGTIEFNYNDTKIEVVNNGHTIQVNNSADSSIKIGAGKFELLQFHFHSPSENTVGNKPFDMEMHLVHKNDQGELAVVGVFLKTGGANNQLSKFWKEMPKSKDKKMLTASINPKDLLPANKSFYHFKGSLTTPPCSEGVSWFVMKDAVDVSKDQVKEFLAIVGNNARPVQADNGRFVLSKN